MEYSTLFTPMKIGNCEIKNRVVMPSMHLGLANFDGTLSKKLINYYEERAKGGAGLIVLETTRINDNHGVTTFLQPSVSKDFHIVRINELAKRVQKYGSKLFVQLQHPGKQTSGLMVNTVPLGIGLSGFHEGTTEKLLNLLPKVKAGVEELDMTFPTVAPSVSEPCAVVKSKVRALKNSEIKELVQEFINGAKRCQLARVDGVELQASQGYLIQQFLSPLTNKRTDEYGGSFENRLRFLEEIIKGIKDACGQEFPIIVRLSIDEFYNPDVNGEQRGYGLETGLEYAKAVESFGADAINVSCGTYENFNTWLEPTSYDCGWSAYLAKEVKKVTKIPIIAANKIRSPKQAEAQLMFNVQDFVALGRSQLADPYWVEKVMLGREDEIKKCISCLNCIELTLKGAISGKPGTCAVNPTVGSEGQYRNLKLNGNGRIVVVIGAGVAGLTVAEILGKRGFKVIVLEKESISGGQLNFACIPPKKSEIYNAICDLLKAVEKVGCEIRYNTEATKELLYTLNPYAVVVATGAKAVKPTDLVGSELKNVYTIEDILSKKGEITNKKIVVIGSGLTGLETANLLISQGNDITVIDSESEIASTAWFQHKDDLIPKMKEAKTTFLLNTKIRSIEEDGIIVSIAGSEETKLFFDGVVLSLGSQSVNELFLELSDIYERVYSIGDAEKIGNIARATTSAYDIAVNKIN